jgi:hypothetical protein
MNSSPSALPSILADSSIIPISIDTRHSQIRPSHWLRFVMEHRPITTECLRTAIAAGSWNGSAVTVAANGVWLFPAELSIVIGSK